MPVRLRLQRYGRKKHPYYYIVATDSRAPRESRYIERLGSYDPNVNPARIDLDVEKSFQWLEKGAQPTNTVRAILSYKGVMYKKHLQRGVKKGAFSQEDADAKFAEWLEQKNQKIAEKIDNLKGAADKDAQDRLEAERKVNEERAAKLKQEEAPEVTTEPEEVGGEEKAEADTAEAPAETQETKTEEAPKEDKKAEKAEAEPAEKEAPAEKAEAEKPKAEEKKPAEPAAKDQSTEAKDSESKKGDSDKAEESKPEAKKADSENKDDADKKKSADKKDDNADDKKDDKKSDDK